MPKGTQISWTPSHKWSTSSPLAPERSSCSVLSKATQETAQHCTSFKHNSHLPSSRKLIHLTNKALQVTGANHLTLASINYFLSKHNCKRAMKAERPSFHKQEPKITPEAMLQEKDTKELSINCFDYMYKEKQLYTDYTPTSTLRSSQCRISKIFSKQTSNPAMLS